MRTVALITVHRTLNYGTMLQIYACNKVFKKENINMLLIDYYRSNDIKDEDLSSILAYYSYRKKQNNINSLKSKILCLAKTMLTYADVRRFKEVCSSFLDSNVEISHPYYSVNELMVDPPKTEIFCSGSDQIWNSDYNGKIDEAYFLSFAPKGANKISLASSIGKDSIENDEKIVMKRFLSQYSSISVREQQASEILDEIGIYSTPIIDPTLLISADEWSEIAENRMIEESYLLIYKLKGDNNLDEVADKIAREKGLKIVRIVFTKFSRKLGEITVCLPTVSEFLSLIKNAEYIVTNSFHGVCFSINFEKQFTAVMRSNYNSRVCNILERLGLSNRLYVKQSSVPVIDTIDYTSVMQRLLLEKEKANRWIRQSVNFDNDERK